MPPSRTRTASPSPRINRYLTAFAAAAFLAGCGGGSDEATTSTASTPAAAAAQLRTAMSAQAQTQVKVSAAVSPAQAAEQLLNFAETTFPNFFPVHQTTGTFDPFLFRYYPQTGVYVGVVVKANMGYTLDGVYVMGGPFGDAPIYVGQVDAFLPANLLSGRAWTSGQQLATGSLIQGGTATASAIDAQGRVTVLFGKVVGSRLTLHALRSDPGGAGTAPNVSEPVAIDNGAPFDYRDGVSLAMSPAGNAVAGWNQRAPCTATTYKTGGTCNYGYYARYLVASNTWEAPQRVSDMHLPAFVASINDAGDVAALYNLPNTEAGTFALAVGWRAANQPGFTSQTWPADAVNGSFIPRAVTLDGSGRIVATGSLTQPLGKNLDIAVYRGNVHTGLGAREVVDLRGASATWQAVWTNPAGQTMLLWSQDNGTRATVYAGALDAADGNWAVTDTGRTPPAVRVDITATLGNDGSFIWYDHPRCSALRRSAGTWTGPAALPSAMCGIVGVLGNPSLSRSGLLVSLHPTDGSWLSYDPWLNQVVSARPTATTGPGYLLSFPRSMSTVPGKLLLADNGVGSYVSVNTFDVLPTAAAPNGDSRGANSVWAWFFK